MLGGLALFAGHPPADLGWVASFALIPLLLIARELARDLEQASVRRFWAGSGWGLVAGLAFFAPLLYWIARFGPVPWLLLSLIQALFVAVWLGGVSWWGRTPGRFVFAPLAWVAVEALRGAWPMGGFPWGVLGYTQHQGGLFLPIARSLGVLGVSLALAAMAALMEEVIARVRAAWREWDGETPVGEVVFGAARVPLIAALCVLVAAVLVGGDPPRPNGDTIDAAAVQGNDQELPPLVDRAALGRIERMVDRMLSATAPLGEDPPELVVWPENSLDADTRRHPALQQRVQQALDIVDGAPLIAGALLDGPEPRTFLNTMVLYGPDSEIEGVAIKRKLVPFGEYVPYRRWFEWYPALRHVPKDGVPGAEPTVFDLGEAVVAPITCYESLFAGLVHDQVREGAQVLVVSTNNASYGRTSATWQHLAFSRLRAVETGRWVLHAGISGVSAVVDPHGRTSQETELFEQAIVRADLPLVDGRTLATRLGDGVGWALGLAALGLLTGEALRRRSRRRTPSP